MSSDVALQWLVVGAVVLGSALYATWTLMPAALRRAFAAAALKLPLLDWLARGMRGHASGSSPCGCSGCDRKPLPRGEQAPGPTRPITLHRRLPR